jgi:hypothetical protein
VIPVVMRFAAGTHLTLVLESEGDAVKHGRSHPSCHYVTYKIVTRQSKYRLSSLNLSTTYAD